jgi:hypothetical protein
MSAVYYFGVTAFLFMIVSALRVIAQDRRIVDRCIAFCSIIAGIGNIALHSKFDPNNVALAMILIDGYLLWIVLRSNFIYRTVYSLLIFLSITLSFLWGIDYIIGSGLLYVSGEPSLFTSLCAILTVAQGIIFVRTANHGRRDTHIDGGVHFGAIHSDKDGYKP